MLTAWGQSRLALRAMLTARQWTGLIATGYLEWRDPATTGVWRIPAVSHLPLMYAPIGAEDTTVAYRLCIQTEEQLPDPDFLLARYTAVRADPEYIWDIAGRVGMQSPADWVATLQRSMPFSRWLRSPLPILLDGDAVQQLAELWYRDVLIWHATAMHTDQARTYRHLAALAASALTLPGCRAATPTGDDWTYLCSFLEYEMLTYLWRTQRLSARNLHVLLKEHLHFGIEGQIMKHVPTLFLARCLGAVASRPAHP